MSWNKSFSPKRSLELLGQLSELCASLGGSQARAVHSLVKAADYKGLLEWSIDYDAIAVNPDSVSDAIYTRQILGLFQKLEFLAIGIDKDAAAYDRFIESEQMCHATNLRLKRCAEDPSLLDPLVARVLHTAQCKIADVLGQVPSVDELSFAFGPGASTNVNGALAFPRGKLSAPLMCSTNLTPLLSELLSEVPEWTNLHATFQDEESWVVSVGVGSGKVAFVPKSAKTRRTIVVEPGLNSFFQKGVGSYIKDRLSHYDIDLSDQTRNQDLAKRGSERGDLATVDLSMASDCVAQELVWNLLPLDWSIFLDQLRTPDVRLPAPVPSAKFAEAGLGVVSKRDTYRVKKFSSMGNGYTFELESLLFYGIAFSVTETLGLCTKDVSVYGDDIIIPVSAYDLLRKVLEHCGFSMNLDKSFCSGYFRESCGADFFNGFDIRPFYQKTLVSERTLFTMHNWFFRHGERELAKLVESMCNPCYLLYGPDGFGDGHLIGNHSLRYNREIKRRGWDGGYFDTYALSSKCNNKLLPGDAVLPSYSVYTRSGKDSPTDPNVIRGSAGYAKISIYTLGRDIFCRKHDKLNICNLPHPPASMLRF